MICKKCKHEWTPRPHLWSNIPEGEKLLKCPICQTWNTFVISEEKIAVIIEERKKDNSSNGSEKPYTKKNSTSELQKPSEDQEVMEKRNLNDLHLAQKDTNISERTKLLKYYEEKQ